MQNPTTSDLVTIVQQCEDIALRFVNQNVRQQSVLKLAQFLKYQTKWKLVTFSENAAKDLWDEIRINLGEDVHDLVVSMTNEFRFLLAPVLGGNNNYDKLYPAIGDSLSWSKESAAVHPEEKQFTAVSADYQNVFKKNPWITFLYLLSMSDIVNKVSNLKVPEV